MTGAVPALRFTRLTEVPLGDLVAHMSDPRLRAHMPLLTGAWGDADARAFVAANGAHLAFAAPDREAVAKAHAEGLDAGASDEGAPGVRTAYPMPDVFAAYLRDPWGNKIELVHGGFSA